MVAIKAVARILASIVVLSAVLILIVAALLKAQNPSTLHDALVSHGILPKYLLSVAPWFIIILELGVGLMALWGIIGRNWRMSTGAIGAIFLCFTVYCVALAVRPPASPAACGCGLSAGPVDSWTPIALRNGAFSFALFMSIPFFPRRSQGTELTTCVAATPA